MLINKLNQLLSEHEIYGYIIVMEPNIPTVSVVIPAYNAMTYLPKAVESVLRQTFTETVGVYPMLQDKMFSSYLYSLKNAIARSANMPKVFVVIPAYNAIAYLPETVESVLRQTFTDFEVLIINNKLL